MNEDTAKLGNIKSNYVLKLIFSFVKEKRKLKTIINNYELQKRIGYNIENYKKCSGILKLKLKNGNAQLYKLDTNILIYEGGYLNGKRNGKGKEYNDYGNLKYEGEYLNGVKNGQIKEYDSYGNLIFEGYYLNGIKNGKCKEYDYGRLVFEGEYLNGEKNGKCKEYRNLIFEGYYLNGMKNGKCKEYDSYSKNLLFEGEYLNGKKMENVKNIIMMEV